MIKFSYVCNVFFIFIQVGVVISSFQSRNLSPNDLSDSAASWADGAENIALLFDESTGGGGGVDISIPSVPIQIPQGTPDIIDAITRWLNNPKKPECKDNKHLYCCEKGAPKMRQVKANDVQIDPLEYAQRRRECRSWSADNPACRWPENIFCCHCVDTRKAAYLCYNQPYTDLPELQNRRPIPDPRQISKPQQDPNPVEQPSDNQKRDIINSAGSIEYPQTAPVLNTENLLYAESPPFKMTETSTGRKRKPDTCTEEFLESVGVSSYRYKYPSRLQPSDDNWREGEGWLDKPNEPNP